MINIRPVSDLRNKYPEIEELVLKENEEVYLTKNGYGTMVVLSLDKYSKIIDEMYLDKIMREKFGNVDINKLLEESEKELDNSESNYLSHQEIFNKLKGMIN